MRSSSFGVPRWNFRTSASSPTLDSVRCLAPLLKVGLLQRLPRRRPQPLQVQTTSRRASKKQAACSASWWLQRIATGVFSVSLKSNQHDLDLTGGVLLFARAMAVFWSILFTDKSLLPGAYYRKTSFNNVEFQRVGAELVSALAFLHGKGVGHGALSVWNIFLDGNKRVQICDLGMATWVVRNQATLALREAVHLPPEALEIHPACQSSTDPNGFVALGEGSGLDPIKGDAYALAVVLWSCWFKRLPFEDRDLDYVKGAVCAGKRPALAVGVGGVDLSYPQPPGTLVVLIKSLWSQDPKDRPTLNEVHDAFMKECSPDVIAAPSDIGKADISSSSGLAQGRPGGKKRLGGEGGEGGASDVGAGLAALKAAAKLKRLSQKTRGANPTLGTEVGGTYVGGGDGGVSGGGGGGGSDGSGGAVGDAVGGAVGGAGADAASGLGTGLATLTAAAKFRRLGQLGVLKARAAAAAAATASPMVAAAAGGSTILLAALLRRRTVAVITEYRRAVPGAADLPPEAASAAFREEGALAAAVDGSSEVDAAADGAAISAEQRSNGGAVGLPLIWRSGSAAGYDEDHLRRVLATGAGAVVLSLADLRVRDRFRAKAATQGAPDLLKPAFKALVKELLAEQGESRVPSDKDLDAAFVVADEDKGGTVDEAEFLKLFQLVKVRQSPKRGNSRRGRCHF